MDPQTENRRPYASSPSVVDVLDRVRAVNVPDKIDDHFMAVASVPKSGHRLVRQALQFLDLIEENSDVTPRLRSLAGAPSGEYKKLLEDAVRTAYKEDLEIIDPVKDSKDTMLDHFQRYEPRSTNEKMRALFIGLCREAGIPVAEQPKQPRTTARSKPVRKRKPRSERKDTRKPESSEPEPTLQSPAPTQPLNHAADHITVPVTPDDVSTMSDKEEFDVIWSALGRLVWNRHRSDQDDAKPRKQLTDGRIDGVS